VDLQSDQGSTHADGGRVSRRRRVDAGEARPAQHRGAPVPRGFQGPGASHDPGPEAEAPADAPADAARGAALARAERAEARPVPFVLPLHPERVPAALARVLHAAGRPRAAAGLARLDSEY